MQRLSMIGAAACVVLAGAVLAGAALADDGTLGRNIAASCASCHGTDGKSVAGMVALAGYEPDKLIQAFKDFKSGAKSATLMHQFARGYDEAQVRAVAAYFAAQK